MTEPIIPPPHLLKKFSEQAREYSKKRGHSGYCKTFAKLCIDWAFQEAAMNDLRVASAEVSGAASQPGSLSEIERRSDIMPPLELTEQWCEQLFGCPDKPEIAAYELVRFGAKYGADQELEACVEWVGAIDGKYGPRLRLARRPKPPSLVEEALIGLEMIDECAIDQMRNYVGFDELLTHKDTIRRALERLQELEGGNG